MNCIELRFDNSACDSTPIIALHCGADVQYQSEKTVPKLPSVGLIIFCLFSVPALAGPRVSLSDKAAMQATMYAEIDRHLVAGKYLHFDLKASKISTLFPAKSHPMIFAMGEHFVLCTDFRDSHGKPMNVDFYLARNEKSFVVFKTAIDQRDVVRKLMKMGQVRVLK